MTEQPTAADRLADYFEPGGFQGFTLDEGRAWTSQQVQQVLIHHREFLRGIIEPTVRDVLAEVGRITRERDETRQHAERLQTWITPRHRYTLTLIDDELHLHCTSHNEEIAHWVEGDGPYPFQPIDNSAHAHEVWHHADSPRVAQETTAAGIGDET